MSRFRGLLPGLLLIVVLPLTLVLIVVAITIFQFRVLGRRVFYG